MCLELAAESPLLSACWAKSFRVNVLHASTHRVEGLDSIRPIRKDVVLWWPPGRLNDCLSLAQSSSPCCLAKALCTAEAVADWTDWKIQRKWTLKSQTPYGRSIKALNTWSWCCQNHLLLLMDSWGPALAHHGGMILCKEWVWNNWSHRLWSGCRKSARHNSASHQGRTARLQHGNHETQK